ncbi:MAG TPA: peptidyl-prolyl cis-trans isomerase [Acidobacteriaceae bacterium]|nr:peptidyl-prolyl cis-trans isomerase [Acidobacteriaceae bacterium]
MTLRFAPSRSVILPTLLAAGLFVTFPVATFAQKGSTQNVADNQQSPYPGSVVEEIVARVNDQVISTSDYNKAAQDLDQQAQQHQWSEQQVFEAKQNLLRDLIDQQLLLSRGKELGITGETELVKQLDQMRKDYHLDTMDDLQKAAEAQGVTWTDFKASMRNHIIEQEVIRQEVGARINISQSEIQAYYDAHKQDFEQPEEETLSEILIPTANPDDAAQVAAAKQKADDAEAKLKGGEDFAALAKTASSGMTAASGGDMGQFKRGQGQLAKVLEDDTFDLKPGQFTEPIRTKQGYLILKVTEHTDAGLAPMKDVEPQIEDQIGMTKMQPALRDYLTKLRENAYLDIRDGYEDSGASPNEMKPVYSAYTPPSKKKKTHVTRSRFNGRGRKADTTAVAKNEQPKKEGIQKPGKKEKIRFGQAPRETLPPVLNQQTTTQVASNDNTVSLGTPDTADTTDQPTSKEKKTRFSSRAHNPKYKKHKGPRVDPFAPPPPTTLETASRQQQGTALGLNGDTSKRKKKSPHKAGPKRRMKDEKQYEEEQEKKPAGPAAPATPSAPTVPVNPAPTGASPQ